MDKQTLAQQPNLDQERHNNWLKQQSPRDLRQVAQSLSDLAHSKLKKEKPSLSEEESV